MCVRASVCVCARARARVCVCVCERERERQTDRQTDRQERDRDRDRDRETEGVRDQTERETETETDTETQRQTRREKERDRQTDRHTDRDRNRDRDRDLHMFEFVEACWYVCVRSLFAPESFEHVTCNCNFHAARAFPGLSSLWECSLSQCCFASVDTVYGSALSATDPLGTLQSPSTGQNGEGQLH